MPGEVGGGSGGTYIGRVMEPDLRPRVLFVEDDPGLRMSYERFFGSRVEPLFAATGAEALVLVREHRPAAAVLDLRLPDTDGVSVFRRIRERHPGLSIIITTGYPDAEPHLRALGLSYHAFLAKPLDLHELAAAIDAVC